MSPSLRRRLLGVLLGTVVPAWLATAAFSYRDARHTIDAMLDAHLRQSAGLLLVAPAGDPTAAHGDGWVLVYQVRDAVGRLLRRSADTSEVPLAPMAEGFADVERGGERWRVFALRDAAHGVAVQVAERYAVRDELAGSVASHLMHPLALALPVLTVLIWLSVRWGLAPLRSFAGEVARRTPETLAPVPAAGAPVEMRPVALALNDLFARVAALIERERRFTADAAHELRTPLAAIKTHAQVALAATAEPERRAAIANVVEGTDRAAHLVEQMLLLARIDAPLARPAAPVRLAEVAARGIAELADAAAAKSIDLGIVEGSDAGVAVPGDAALLGVLLRNLLDNAVRYTPSGGRVDVALERASGTLLLRVADDGPGIPPAEIGRVLDRFYRLPGSGEPGSGLGLAIAVRIADLHGAALDFGDGPGGHGLSVTVTFPSNAA